MDEDGIMGNKTKIRILFWIVAIVTVFLIGVACIALGLSEEVFQIILTVYATVMVAAWFAVNMFYVVKLTKKVNALLPILYDENDPDRYLAELKGLIGDTKSAAFRSVYLINSAAAYCDKEEYNRAKGILLELEPRKIPRVNRLVYYLDLGLIHMHLNEDDEAMRIWTDNKAELEKCKDSDNMGTAISTLRIFSMLKEGRTQEGLEEIERARKKWIRAREQKEFDFLERKAQGESGCH